ncbi:catenin delta-2, partial [Clonorchis sinensis]
MVPAITQPTSALLSLRLIICSHYRPNPVPPSPLTCTCSVNVRTPNNGERNGGSVAWVAVVPFDDSLVILIGHKRNALAARVTVTKRTFRKYHACIFLSSILTGSIIRCFQKAYKTDKLPCLKLLRGITYFRTHQEDKDTKIGTIDSVLKIFDAVSGLNALRQVSLLFTTMMKLTDSLTSKPIGQTKLQVEIGSALFHEFIGCTMPHTQNLNRKIIEHLEEIMLSRLELFQLMEFTRLDKENNEKAYKLLKNSRNDLSGSSPTQNASAYTTSLIVRNPKAHWRDITEYNQYDIYDRIENNRLTSVCTKSDDQLVQSTLDERQNDDHKRTPFMFWATISFQTKNTPDQTERSMNSDSTMFRYYPPERFTPSTPPSSEGNHKPSVSNTALERVTPVWDGEHKNDTVSRTHIPGPVHIRQRSVPAAMPSFGQYQLNKDIIPGDSGLERNTSSSSLSKEATGALGDDTYNLVIDIHVHSGEVQSGNERMTKSLITQTEASLTPRYLTSEIKGRVDKTFIGDCFDITPRRHGSTATLERLKRNMPPLNSQEMNYKIGLSQANKKFSNLSDSVVETNDTYSEVSRTSRGIKCSNHEENCIQKLRIQTPMPQRKPTNMEQAKPWKSVRPCRSNSVSIQYHTPESGADTNHQDMDILQVVRLLQSPEPEVVINASAYLQHLVYRNPNMKERTRQCGGIAALVQLLYSEHAQICQNTVGVLRNLTSGDNLEIKEELERVGGIRALSWLIENRQRYPHPLPQSTDSTTVTDELTICTGPHAANRTENAPAATATKLLINEEFRPTLDSAAAVLCNLAAVNHLKRSVLQEAVIPSLVHTVLKPAACQTVSNDSRTVLREPSFITVLFRNVAAVLRNVSSSEDRDVRDRMRQCPHLLWSLITILRAAVRLQCFDTKSVEHCVCCLRNLCFSLQQSPASAAPHLQSVNTQARKSDNPVDNRSQSGSIKLFRSKNSSLKARSYSETENAPDGPDLFPPKSVLNLLYQTGTIQMLVDLLQSSSNPCTLEAAAGTIQNLTAGGVLTGPIVRKTIRNLQSLPILVELISAPTRRVSTAAANALRNLALEEESCLLLGKHALVRILTALGDCANSLLSQPVAERHPNGGEWMVPTSTRSGSLLRLSQVLSSSQTQSVYSARSVATALLGLCCVLVRGKLQHARRFVTLGGVETCQEILCNTSDAYQRRSTETLTDHTSVERVNQLAHQLLELLWSFVELRPIYKLVS